MIDPEELEALRKDALRYRWLRDQARTEGRDGGWVGSWRLPFLDAWNDSPVVKYHINRRTFDEAVDAEMLKTP